MSDQISAIICRSSAAGSVALHPTSIEASGTTLPVAENRRILWFEHQAQIQANLTLKAAVRYQNDATVMRDFYEPMPGQSQPTTFLEVQQQLANFTLNALTVGRVSDFVETVERLPDITFAACRNG